MLLTYDNITRMGVSLASNGENRLLITMNRLRLRCNRCSSETSRNLRIGLEDSMEYTSNLILKVTERSQYAGGWTWKR